MKPFACFAASACTSILIAVSAACGQAQQPASAAPARSVEPPTLLVFITIDQMRADYFQRFGPQFQGGLRRLGTHSAFFSNAHQDHGITETAPGHASTMSGRFPRSTGIIENSAGVNDGRYPLVLGSGTGASPMRFQGTVLFDWMHAAHPDSRALSVSRKDRGAILPLGRAKQSIFWYAPSGEGFTTSRWYADTLPTWVTRFNKEQPSSQYAGKVWNLLLPESSYPEPDSVPAESRGRNFLFPHGLPADSAQAARVLPAVPWMDQYTLNFALAGLQAMQLGTGEHTDLLAISLSTTDAIGHQYGPDSREIHDQLLRLDRFLGTFIDSLYTLRDSSRIIFALTGDHGVSSFPEVAAARRGGHGAYVDAMWDSASAVLQRAVNAGLDTLAFEFDAPYLILHREKFAGTKVDPDSLAKSFIAAVRVVDGVQRADLWSDLQKADTTHDKVARRWQHMFPPSFPATVIVTLAPNSYWGRGSAQHGTPQDTDTNVPVLFYGAPFKPGQYTEFARVVDLAPTLAVVLGVKPTEPLDGRVLRSALR